LTERQLQKRNAFHMAVTSGRQPSLRAGQCMRRLLVRYGRFVDGMASPYASQTWGAARWGDPLRHGYETAIFPERRRSHTTQF
jgi:hypothetical protein